MVVEEGVATPEDEKPSTDAIVYWCVAQSEAYPGRPRVFAVRVATSLIL
jgi:hypothetical protein